MTRRAGDVLSGLALAAKAVGAPEAIIYLKGSFARSAAALELAKEGMPSEGLKITIQRGEDSYVAGEETALLESIEGRRAWPRPKPPLPCAVGLWGRPTLVQNVETLSRAVAAVADPESFRNSEKTFVSLWGHVRRPGVYEVPLGTPLVRVIDLWGGGAPDGVGIVFPGGPSTPPLSAAELETPLDPDALRAQGSALGTAAMLVIGESTCPVSVGAALADFFERESCGQCPPCVVGTANLARGLRLLASGRGRAEGLEQLRETAGFMSGHGYCAHSRAAALGVTGLLNRFAKSVHEHVGGGGRRGRHADPFRPGSRERVAIEEQERQ